MIAVLEAQGDYRVLRRLRSPEPLREAPAGTRRALLADVETTWLDPDRDEIIELAMVPFFYTATTRSLGSARPSMLFKHLGRLVPACIWARWTSTPRRCLGLSMAMCRLRRLIFAGIVATRPPASVVLTDWQPMTPALGLADDL